MVSRLVSALEGTDAAHIADCLGLDPARYRSTAGGAYGKHVHRYLHLVCLYTGAQLNTVALRPPT